MNFLRKRLVDFESITYLNLADKRHEDFAFYDDRLREVIQCDQLRLYPQNVVHNYDDLLVQYRALHPPSLWKFRAKLKQIKDDCFVMNDVMDGRGRRPLDYKMVTYKTVNPL